MTLFTIKKAFHEMKNMGLKKFLKTFKFQVSYHNKKKNNKYLKKIYKEYYPYVSKTYGGKNREYPSLTKEEKNMFFFWWDGIDSLPNKAKRNLERMKELYGDTFNIVFIDKRNFKEISGMKQIFIDAFMKNHISIQTFSDILRFSLIYKKGGIWVDSTIFFTSKIDLESQLEKQSILSLGNQGMKGWFELNGEYCTWSDFFIGGRRNSLICEAMLDLYEKYLSKHKDILIYFLIDDFLMLLKLADVEDGALKRLSIYESSPFYIADHFKDELSKNNLDMIYSVPQKIDRRENYDNDNPNSIYNLVVLNGLSYEDAQKHCSM